MTEIMRQLREWIGDFDMKVDNTHEVGIQIVSGGQRVAFHLQQVKCVESALVCFSGKTDSGEPVTVIQHLTQLNFSLEKVFRLSPEPQHRQLVQFQFQPPVKN